MKRRQGRLGLPLAVAALLALPAAPAQAVTFGPDLGAATADNGYTCSLAGGFSGCTVEDPTSTDMELVLPDPVVHGDQTGVVTAIHVRSAATMPAQFVVVEWSGKPGDAQPFPSGVMALSQQVTLRPGLNDFNTNLPVDRRLASNGFESWSVVALNVLDGTSPVPAQLGGSFATTGLLFDNGLPLTQTTSDLTVPPHNVAVSGFPPMTLLLSGDVTITTPGVTPGPGPNPPPPVPPRGVPQVAVPASGRIAHNAAGLRLRCLGATACLGTLLVQDRPATAAATARARPALTYAQGRFSIPAGGSRSVRVTLSPRGRQALRRRRTLRAYANVRLSGGRVASSPLRLTR